MLASKRKDLLMATMRQIAANRRNSQKSTGPRTPEGKNLTRFNALKHGIDAKSQCLPTEDPDALASLAAEYHERFSPATPEERALVDVLVSAEWDLRRFRVASAQLWQYAAVSRTFPSDAQHDLPLADGFQYKEKTFSRLQRMIDSAQRNYRQALRDLLDLQFLRTQPADPPPQPQQPKPSTPKLASFRKPPQPVPNTEPEPPRRESSPPPGPPA